MRSTFARSLAVMPTGFVAMAVGPARAADPVFDIGSSFIISGTNAPNDFADAVTLSPGSTFIDGGALVLTQNIVNASNGEWLVLDVQTSNGSDIAGDQTANWGIAQSGIQLATPSDWTERYFDLGAGGALANPVANLSNQTSGTPVFVAPNPITGAGTVFLGTQTLASNATTISHGHEPNPDFSYRFLIGSGRAGIARHGGERTGAQLERVVAGAMRPCAEWGEISRAPFPGQCAAAVRRKWARANSFW